VAVIEGKSPSSRERRAGRNQAAFREINEQIKLLVSKNGNTGTAAVDWLCECAHEGCVARIQTRLADYERVRSDPLHFIVSPSDDHVVAAAEVVVETTERYWVVEKIGEAVTGVAEASSSGPEL
jgi:hypothetical protein